MVKDRFRPGAGLPRLEGWLLRRFLAPRLFRKYPPAAASAGLGKSMASILRISRSLSEEQLRKVVKIKRVPGLEYSSLAWSLAMVLEHLVKVGRGSQAIIDQLAQGKRLDVVVNTANVKPDGSWPDPVGALESWLAGYLELVGRIDWSAHPSVTHVHPWIGPMTAAQWHAFVLGHVHIHMRQIQRILNRL